MAENTPNVPGGAMPPKPSEAAKVQPKKETVRITLPPKPTAAPTVKLPSLSPATAAAPAPAAAPAAPAPRAGTSLASRPAATSSGTSAGRAAPASRAPIPPSRASAAARVSPMDSFLAITVGITGLAAAGVLFFLWYTLNTAVTTFVM